MRIRISVGMDTKTGQDEYVIHILISIPNLKKIRYYPCVYLYLVNVKILNQN